MIITIILQLVESIIKWLNTFLPPVQSLPWGIDSVLVSGVGYVRYITVYFPPLGTLISAFLIYIGFIFLFKIIGLIPIVRNILN